MKIAIASSGLGHVARGIETWAANTAEAVLKNVGRRTWDVECGEEKTVGCGLWTVDCGQEDTGRGDFEVVLFKGSGRLKAEGGDLKPEFQKSEDYLRTTDSDSETQVSSIKCQSSSVPQVLGFRPQSSTVVLRCARRGSVVNRILTTAFRRLGGWRYGFGSDYQTEQTTFAWRLIPALRRGGFDIVHLQDPWLAWLLQKACKAGSQPAKVILAHGTEESAEFLGRFQYVQHLAPWHMREASGMERREGDNVDCGLWTVGDPCPVPNKDAQATACAARSNDGGIDTEQRTTDNGQLARHSFAIPNFVDTDKYRPGRNPELRARLGIPESAFVVLSVAAIKKSHKRIDYLIREIARGSEVRGRRSEVRDQESEGGDSSSSIQTSLRPQPTVHSPQSTTYSSHLFLLIVGARTSETDELIAMADELLPGRVRVLADLPHDEMPALYRVADLFALCSLKEMMPIAVLEAMASGLPVIANRHPVLEWMVGEENVDSELWTVGCGEKREVESGEKDKVGSEQSDLRSLGEDGCVISELSASYIQPSTSHLPQSALSAGGECIDMGSDGVLAGVVLKYQMDSALRERAAAWARERAVKMFSKETVVPQIVEMYRKVIGNAERSCGE